MARIDWHTIYNDLDAVSARVDPHDVMWFLEEVRDNPRSSDVHGDAAAYAMARLGESKKRARDPEDIAAIERAEDAILALAKQRRWTTQGIRKFASRSELIQRAASLPVGHPERRAILAGLTKVALSRREREVVEAVPMPPGFQTIIGLTNEVEGLDEDEAWEMIEALERKGYLYDERGDGQKIVRRRKRL